jgi:excisionase family DNA binding protein
MGIIDRAQQELEPIRLARTPVSKQRGDPYLPLKELSQYSGLSLRKLRQHLTDPVHPLPHYRVGGKILVRQSDFDAWMNNFRVATTARGIDTIVDDVVCALR